MVREQRGTSDGTTATTIDAAGAVTSYGYDARARQTTAVDPDNRTTTTGYDADSNVVTAKDPMGRTTTTTYDADNRVTAVSYSDGTTPGVTAIGYDPAGRRVSMTDGTGTSTWTYDVFGELTSTVNGAGAAVSYTYDDDGNQKTITYPGAIGTVTNGFDAANQLTSVTDPSSRKTTFGYNADGANTTTTYPNGTVVTAGYNTADQQTSTTVTSGSTTLGAISYGRDNAGQLAAQTPSGGLPGSAQTFSYTSLQQVKTSVTGGTSTTFGYDTADNLATNAGTTQKFDPAGQLCWSTTATVTGTPACSAAPTGATKYGYDGDGRRTSTTPASGTGSTYSYDQANRLTTATTPVGSGTYTYNGDGLRASKTVGSTTTRFVWGTGNLLSDGTAYLYGPGGMPIEQINGTSIAYYVHDQLSSTIALLTSTGTVGATWAYDVYGRIVSVTGTLRTPLLYGAGYTDSETSQIYLQARYYDPSTGQFLSIDPEVALTGYSYGYVGGNPLSRIDPSGLSWWNPTTWSRGTWIAVGLGVAAVATGGAAVAVYGVAGAGALASTLIEVGALEVGEGAAAGIIGIGSIASSGTHSNPRPAGVGQDWESRPSNTGGGTIWQSPGAVRNSSSVRIMPPGYDSRYPNGYVVFTNSHNQPVNINGKPLGKDTTHIACNPDGSYPLPTGWPN